MRLELKEGTLMVAHPNIQLPYIAKAVILLMQFDKLGVVGLNIAALPGDEIEYIGGPGQLPSTLILHPTDADWNEFARRIGTTGFATTAIRSEAELPGQLESSMQLTGHHAWTDDQLRSEITCTWWHATVTTLKELMAVPPEKRWELAAEGVGVQQSA